MSCLCRVLFRHTHQRRFIVRVAKWVTSLRKFSLRLHYSHTLRHWKENCIANKQKIIEMFDEKFFRMWEFYLAGCEMAFKWGDQVVYQFQLTKDYSSTPVTRDYIYQ